MPVAPSPAVSRACDVLALLAEEAEQPLRLADVARRLDMPRATCQTILLALCERGFAVRHDPAVAYTLGPACVRVGEAAGRSLPVVALAAHAVATLARLTGFASGSVLRAGDTVQVADAAPGMDPFGPRVALGQGVSFVAPFGAVFAAWSDDRVRDSWLDRCDPPLDERERARYLDALGGHTRASGCSRCVPSSAPTSPK